MLWDIMHIVNWLTYVGRKVLLGRPLKEGLAPLIAIVSVVLSSDLRSEEWVTGKLPGCASAFQRPSTFRVSEDADWKSSAAGRLGGKVDSLSDGLMRVTIHGVPSQSKDVFDRFWNDFSNLKGVSSTYTVRRHDWFVVSGVRDGTEFYTKAWYLQGGVFFFSAKYPRSQTNIYSSVLVRMLKGFTPSFVPASTNRGSSATVAAVNSDDWMKKKAFLDARKSDSGVINHEPRNRPSLTNLSATRDVPIRPKNYAPHHPTLSLASDHSGFLLFANDNWVVRGKVVGRSEEHSPSDRTELIFFDSKNLTVRKVVTVGYVVVEVGLIPNNGTSVFYIVGHYHDRVNPAYTGSQKLASVIYLLNIATGVNEMVWSEGLENSSRFFTKSSGNRLSIVVSEKGCRPVDMAAVKRVGDVLVRLEICKQFEREVAKLGSVVHSGDEADINDILYSRHRDVLKEDCFGGRFLNSLRVLSPQVFSQTSHYATFGSVSSFPKLVQASSSGALISYDFTNFRKSMRFTTTAGCLFPAIFKNGDFAAVSDGNIFIFGENEKSVVPLPDSDRKAAASDLACQ